MKREIFLEINILRSKESLHRVCAFGWYSCGHHGTVTPDQGNRGGPGAVSVSVALTSAGGGDAALTRAPRESGRSARHLTAVRDGGPCGS